MAATLLANQEAHFVSRRTAPLTAEQREILAEFVAFEQTRMDELQSMQFMMEIPGMGLRLDDGNEPLIVQMRTKARDSVQGTMNEGAHQAILGKSMSGKQVIQAFGVEDPLQKGG